MKENGQSDQKEKKAQDVSFFIKKMTIQWSMKVFFLSDLVPQRVLTVTLGPG